MHARQTLNCLSTVPRVCAFQVGHLPFADSHVCYRLSPCLSPHWRCPCTILSLLAVMQPPHQCLLSSMLLCCVSSGPLSAPEHYDFDPILYLSLRVSGPRTLSSDSTVKAAAGLESHDSHAPSHNEVTPHSEALHLLPQSGMELGCLISHCLCVFGFLRVRHSLTPVVLRRWMECWGPGLCMKPAPSY